MTDLFTYRVEVNGIIFIVDKYGTLFKMLNKENNDSEVHIPHILPNGKKITCIARFAIEGEYNRIIIDDRINKICEEAFRNSQVSEVVWPISCKVIEKSCFEDSSISKIYNIEYVKSVGESAFASSKISSIRWPLRCNAIPNNCFHKSALKEISNIAHVVDIGSGAFANSQIESIDYPEKCSVIPSQCFFGCSRIQSINLDHIKSIGHAAFAYSSIKGVHWPSACFIIPQSCFFNSDIESLDNVSHVTQIGSLAFGNADKLKSIDLSRVTECAISPYAFANMKPDKVVLPYYIMPEPVLFDGSLVLRLKNP